MRFVSTISGQRDLDSALQELLAPIDRRITPGAADLALVFISAAYAAKSELIANRVHDRLPNSVVIGCTAEGTIGVDQELERVPSIALVAAELPGVHVHPFYLRQEQLESAQTVLDWERMVAVAPDSSPVFIAFADPFRFHVLAFVEAINEYFPGAPLVGGVASAASGPRENRLIANGAVHDEGLVGVALSGELVVRTVVSQGCRPIGKPYVITRGERHIVRELGGRAALEQVHNMLATLPPQDDQLARQSLLIGRVIDEYKGKFGRGDFLIHNIIGVDRGSGAIGIAGHARTGATVQFHVRDAASADEDIRSLLAPHADTGVEGAMLFGCNGRGTHMWTTPGHDVGVLRELLGNVPVAGFFCGGEFGPIGGRNFVHGFTASIALFSAPAKQP